MSVGRFDMISWKAVHLHDPIKTNVFLSSEKLEIRNPLKCFSTLQKHAALYEADNRRHDSYRMGQDASGGRLDLIQFFCNGPFFYIDKSSVSDPDPPGSTAFGRIRIHFNPRLGSGSGSGSTSISFLGFGSGST